MASPVGNEALCRLAHRKWCWD